MADGARLAADVHLPGKDWETENESYATIIQLTRYNRNVRVNWPFNKFRIFVDKDRKRTAPAAHTAALTAELVKAGYAVIVVDIRGTGASSGARPVDSHPLELDDYKKVVSWVKAQKWSDGIVGASGTGYDGRAAAQMAARGGVGAVAMMFATLDPFADEVAPGGIPCTGFLESTSALAAAADRALPLGSIVQASTIFDWAAHRLDWALGTVTAVEGWENDIEAITAAHTDNYDAAAVAAAAPDLCKDDVLFKGKSKSLSYVELEDRDRIVKGLKKHNVAVRPNVDPESAYNRVLAVPRVPRRGPWDVPFLVALPCRSLTAASNPILRPFLSFPGLQRRWLLRRPHRLGAGPPPRRARR